jgi:hypothetical protein
MKMTPGRRALDKIYKRRDRYEIPEWQRGEVWDTPRKQQLIDSILRGWKLPKFYFLKLDDDNFEVVDGQQRLSAIYEFFANELTVSEESAQQFGGPYYKDLPQRVSDTFDDFEIEFDAIEDASEEELKQFFQRLQQGLPLTSSVELTRFGGHLMVWTGGVRHGRKDKTAVPCGVPRPDHGVGAGGEEPRGTRQGVRAVRADHQELAATG